MEFRAGRLNSEFLEESRLLIPDSDQTLLLIFGPSGSYPVDAFTQAELSFPSAHILGCSGWGAWAGPGGFSDSDPVVAMLHLEKSRIIVRTIHANTSDPHDTFSKVSEAARQLAEFNPTHIQFYATGDCNGEAALSGLASAMRNISHPCTVSGGLAGTDSMVNPTWVLSERSFLESTIVLIGFVGSQLHSAVRHSHGWTPSSTTWNATCAYGAHLELLNDQPARQVFRAAIDPADVLRLPDSARKYPLFIRRPNDPDGGYLRTIFDEDPRAQSLITSGSILEGSSVSIARTTTSDLLAVCDKLQSSMFDIPTSAFIIGASCCGRREYMGASTIHETEKLLSAWPNSIGFWSYGEISGVIGKNQNLFHNQTIALAALWED